MESPLDSLIKDEPDLSPGTPVLELSAALAYPTFDLHHFQDENSLMEELNNSLNGHSNFAGNDNDDFVPNISNNLLQALDIPTSCKQSHESLNQPDSVCDSLIQNHDDHFGCTPTISSLLNHPVSHTEPHTSSSKKPCAIHGPLNVHRRAHQSMPETCIGSGNGHQLDFDIDQQDRPPPAYMPPVLTKFRNTPPPPPYASPAADGDSNSQDTPPPNLMPIDYLFPPRAETESTLVSSMDNQQPHNITKCHSLDVLSLEHSIATQGHSVISLPSPVTISTPSIGCGNITTSPMMWTSSTVPTTTLPYQTPSSSCVTSLISPQAVLTPKQSTITAVVPALVTQQSSSQVKPRRKKRKKSSAAQLVLGSPTVKRPNSLSINTGMALPALSAIQNQQRLMMHQLTEQQKQQLADLHMQPPRPPHLHILQQQLSQGSMQNQVPQAQPNTDNIRTQQKAQHASPQPIPEQVSQVVSQTTQHQEISQPVLNQPQPAHHVIQQPVQHVHVRTIPQASQHIVQHASPQLSLLQPTSKSLHLAHGISTQATPQQSEHLRSLQQRTFQPISNISPLQPHQVAQQQLTAPSVTMPQPQSNAMEQQPQNGIQQTQQLMLQQQNQPQEHNTNTLKDAKHLPSQKPTQPKHPHALPVSISHLFPPAVVANGQRLQNVVPITPGFPIPPGLQVLLPPGLRPPFPLPVVGSVPMSMVPADAPTVPSSIQSYTGNSTLVTQSMTTPKTNTTLPHVIFCPPYGIPPRGTPAPVALIPSPIPPRQCSVTPHMHDKNPEQCDIGNESSASPIVVKTEVLTPTSEEPSTSPLWSHAATITNSIPPLLTTNIDITTAPVTSSVSTIDHTAKSHHCAVHGLVNKRTSSAVVPPIQHVQPLIDSIPPGSSIVTCATPPYDSGVTPIRLPVPPGTTLMPMPAPPGAPVVNGVTPRYVIPIRVPSRPYSASTTTTTPGAPASPFPAGFPARYLIPVPAGMRPSLSTGAPFISMIPPGPGALVSQPCSLNSATSPLQPPTSPVEAALGQHIGTSPSNTTAVKVTPQLVVRPSSTPINHDIPLYIDQAHKSNAKSITQCQSAPTTPSSTMPVSSTIPIQFLNVPLTTSTNTTNKSLDDHLHNSSVSSQQNHDDHPHTKPSDSTKRIIEALRAQMNHPQGDPTINCINNIIMNQSVRHPVSSVTANHDVVDRTDIPKNEMELSACVTDAKAKLQPTRLFPPLPKITVTSPVDSKPFMLGETPTVLLPQSSISPMKQIVSPIQIVSPTQVVHPTVVTSTGVVRDTVLPKLISITQSAPFTPPSLRMTSTHILHKPAAIVHPASSLALSHLKKVDPKAGELGPVVVITPQTQGLVSQTTVSTGYSNPGSTELRSPDSGFNETCASPADPSLMVRYLSCWL